LLGFFSFTRPQRSPSPRVAPLAIEIVSQCTKQDYTWAWRIRGSQTVNAQRGARIDALVEQYCKAQEDTAIPGTTRTQIITVLLP
jgi:hypothetical protein